MHLISKDYTKKCTEEMSFMWMLYSSISEVPKFEAYTVLNEFFSRAFGVFLNDSDLDVNLIKRIRVKLLENSGINKPILKQSTIWNRIEKSIIFED
ncbi:hypothetical protein DRH27_00105 [Candidatus Falkowbacteria bacterium]|nr:MAG: hypothetical protein DRH27_00105 [Candidatus Falkowbacteria bacterium]